MNAQAKTHIGNACRALRTAHAEFVDASNLLTAADASVSECVLSGYCALAARLSHETYMTIVNVAKLIDRAQEAADRAAGGSP